jgi:hypothetical protein
MHEEKEIASKMKKEELQHKESTKSVTKVAVVNPDTLANQTMH